MFTKLLNIMLAEYIKIPVEGLSPLLDRKIHERLVFTNPDYEMRHNRGEWLGNVPAQINCIRQKGSHYFLPRGFLDQLLELCKKCNQPYRLIDKRSNLPPVDIEFHGELKSYQQDAAEGILEKDFATLVGGHKSGKTVISLYTIAQRRQATLILIPRLDLLQGWLTKIENFLQIPSSEVGIFSGGEHQIGREITIAHSGEAMRFWRKLVDQVGYVVVDECQRCPSKVFTHLLTNFKSKYMLGLSNTAQRKDRLSRLMFYYIGDLIYSINEKDAREGRGVIHANVITRQTEFEYPYTTREDFTPMMHALCRDEPRTALIVEDIEREINEGSGTLLVLSSLYSESELLRKELSRRGINVLAFEHIADSPEPDAEDEEDTVPANCPVIPDSDSPTVVFVTPEVLVKCASGFKTNVLILAEPVYFRKALASAIRDLHKNGLNDGPRLRIYDYVDSRIGLLENYFRMRSYNYGVHPELLLKPSVN